MTEHKQVYRDSDGVRRTLITDTDRPNDIVVHTEVQFDAILESIKAKRDALPAKSVNKHLATVPMTVYEKSIVEQWGPDDWKKWLNDPDNAAFRVWQGRV
jgi:hypothetical protein